jgi:integrase
MSERLHFTADRIKRLPAAPSGQRTSYADEGCRGLFLRVTDKGTKSFVLVRHVKGRCRRFTLGQFREDGTGISCDEARRRARIHIGELDRGRPVVEEQRRARRMPTLAEYFERWLRLHGKVDVTSHTWKQKEGTFKLHCATLAARRLDDVTKEDTRNLLTSIRDRLSPRSANAVRTILHQVYRQAIEDGVLPRGYDIPLHGKFQVPPPRNRFILPVEMEAFARALQGYAGTCRNDAATTRAFILMALFTGQRRGNVLRMRFDEVDEHNRIWSVPASQTKTARPYSILLSPEAWAVYASQARAWQQRSAFVFPNVLDPTCPLRDPKRAWHTIRCAAGMPDLHFHDLRHTYATYQHSVTGDLKSLQLNLHHADIATTGNVYTHMVSTENLRVAAAAGAQAMSRAAGIELHTLVEFGYDVVELKESA